MNISSLLVRAFALGAFAFSPLCGTSRAAEPTVSATAVPLLEGNAGQVNAQFRVVLSQAATKEVRVSFATQSGTATAGSDFVAVRGNLIFAPGVREQIVSVPVVGDKIFEPNESFFLSLYAPGYTYAEPAGVCTIRNDDAGTSPSTAGPGKIVYGVYNPVFQIWALNADGSNQTCLTPEPGYNAEHDVSPDGSKIAYVVYNYTDKTDDIWTMNANGSGKTRLTRGQGFNKRPIWSPDGRRIAFQSNRDGTMKLYAMSANGTSPILLSPITLYNRAHSLFSASCSWSPDARRIVFTSEHNLGTNLFLASSDGRTTTRLTNDNLEDSGAVWTPDGSRIVFSSNRTGDGSDGSAPRQLFSVDWSGKTFVRLTTDPLRNCYSPSFSPDGSRLAFVSARRGAIPDIECMNVNGSGRRVVTYNNREDSDPRWSPDSSRIVYTSVRFANSTTVADSIIYSVNPTDLNVRVLSNRKESHSPRPAPGFVPAPSTTSVLNSPSAPAS